MAITKLLKEWELAKNIIARDREKYPEGLELTEAEITDLLVDGQLMGLDHKQRTAFLVDNGYPVTHENLINAELQPLNQPEE